ncbi:signal peptidase II [Taklimakanibacter deserti]|uniref:signal peptidase II n=1 Tax=Taklimakanibacter deserti TaxID=2267839 RepID=UPI0034D746FC
MRLWGRLSGLGLVFASASFAVDQAFKWWMLHVVDIEARQPIAVLPVFDIVLAWNRGISYGWLSDGSWVSQGLLIALAVIISGALWTWIATASRPLTAAAVGLVLGGALANAFDRAVYGAVADFFSFHIGNFEWYIFNLADVAIVAGVALLVYESLSEARNN